jgi:16S rRNA (cytosine967-C5)-methyltransferase
MTPAARLQAAIEILEGLERSPSAVDALVAAYWRRRRYAGAKDRRAVGDLVFAVLREKTALDWRLKTAGLLPSPRLAVLAQAMAEGYAIDDLAKPRLYGPKPLSPAEGSALSRLGSTPSAAPDWVKANVPEWLTRSLRRRFADDFLPEALALNRRAPFDLRINTLKTTREEVLRGLASLGIAAKPTPFSPIGVRIDAPTPLRTRKLYRSGLVEPQDESSQIAALLVDARPAMTVLDMCAGAGGKTLALAALMRNRGDLIAFDRDPARLAELRRRMARAGARNIRIVAQKGVAAAKADRVLLDAPCSGTGTWRRQPDARFRLTPERLQRHCHEQDQLLRRASRLVAPGGRLVYAVCSILPEEAEDRIERFLSERDDFAPVAIEDVWPHGDSPAKGSHLLLTPRRHGTDGFFLAILARLGG